MFLKKFRKVPAYRTGRLLWSGFHMSISLIQCWVQNFSVPSQMLWTLLTLPEARHSPAFTTGFAVKQTLSLHCPPQLSVDTVSFLCSSFLGSVSYDHKCSYWGLADSLQMSLLSKLQPISLALHRSSAVNTVGKVFSHPLCALFLFCSSCILPPCQSQT